MRLPILCTAAVTLLTIVTISTDTFAQFPSQPPGSEPLRGLTDAEKQQIQRLISQTVRETGVVDSSDIVEIRCLAVGESVVLTVVPEGSRVAAGDVLVELDDSKVRQQLLEQQLEAAQSKAAVEAAKANVEQATERSSVFLPLAKLKLQVAEMARDRYLGKEGEFQLELATADRQISAAKHRLQVAEKIRSKGPASDALAWEIKDAEQAIQLAEAARNLLTTHIREHQETILKIGVSEAQAKLLQIRIDFTNMVQSSLADLQSKQLAHEMEVERLSHLEQQLQHCRITAPQDGVVVYTQNASRRSQTLEPGAVVRERQSLMHLPNQEKLHVDVSVHESQIERVQLGQQVTLQFDALPGMDVIGKVALIDRVPKPTTWLAQDVVQYNVRVTMDDPPRNLKLGMTAVAEIQVVPHLPE